MKTMILILCMTVGTTALLDWASNPILPGYPIFFVGWNSYPWCRSSISRKSYRCFRDCMTANGQANVISAAYYSEAGLCPPTKPGGCDPRWKQTACQCGKRCECKIGRCIRGPIEECIFCKS